MSRATAWAVLKATVWTAGGLILLADGLAYFWHRGISISRDYQWLVIVAMAVFFLSERYLTPRHRVAGIVTQAGAAIVGFAAIFASSGDVLRALASGS